MPPSDPKPPARPISHAPSPRPPKGGGGVTPTPDETHHVGDGHDHPALAVTDEAPVAFPSPEGRIIAVSAEPAAPVADSPSARLPFRLDPEALRALADASLVARFDAAAKQDPSHRESYIAEMRRRLIERDRPANTRTRHA